jgi:hypothetical protein
MRFLADVCVLFRFGDYERITKKPSYGGRGNYLAAATRYLSRAENAASWRKTRVSGTFSLKPALSEGEWRWSHNPLLTGKEGVEG